MVDSPEVEVIPESRTPAQWSHALIAAVAAAVLTGLWFAWLFEGPVPLTVLLSQYNSLIYYLINFGNLIHVVGQ